MNINDAFYLSTLGGAISIGLGDKIGSFEVNKEFDGLIVDVNSKNSPIDYYKNDDLEKIFQKFLLNGDDRNIINIFVKGKKIKF
jgi:guanine deaminase